MIFKKYQKENLKGSQVSMELERDRSSHQRCHVKKGFLKTFAKTPILESLFNKVTGLQ